MDEKKPITYRDSGVDISAKTGAIAGVKGRIEATLDANCLSRFGSFGGLYRVPTEEFREPVLVSSTDSVGTKVKVAIAAGRHDTVGQDIVNHCVNDILVQGARPLFFLDYIGTSKVDSGQFDEIISGLAKACSENGCALLGGETAEMPELYHPGEYDLVGTIVGVVEKDRILDGSSVRPGDRLVGLPSSGLHTNGYTLARKVLFERGGLSPDSRPDRLGSTVGDALLAVHRSYLRECLPLLEKDVIRAMSHITGGGLLDNIPRVLPEGTAVEISKKTFEVPPIFRLLAELGPVPESECWHVFNMGVGMVLIVRPGDLDSTLGHLEAAGADAREIGEVVDGDRTVTIS